MKKDATHELWGRFLMDYPSDDQRQNIERQLIADDSVTPAELWDFLTGCHVSDDVRRRITLELNSEDSVVSRILQERHERSQALVSGNFSIPSPSVTLQSNETLYDRFLALHLEKRRR